MLTFPCKGSWYLRNRMLFNQFFVRYEFLVRLQAYTWSDPRTWTRHNMTLSSVLEDAMTIPPAAFLPKLSDVSIPLCPEARKTFVQMLLPLDTWFTDQALGFLVWC